MVPILKVETLKDVILDLDENEKKNIQELLIKELDSHFNSYLNNNDKFEYKENDLTLTISRKKCYTMIFCFPCYIISILIQNLNICCCQNKKN